MTGARLVLALTTLLPVASQVAAQAPSANQFNAWLDAAEGSYARGDYRESVAMFERLLPHVPRFFGQESANQATIMNSLGNAYFALGEFARAEAMFQRTIKIREIRLGNDHPEMAVALNNLGNVYGQLHRLADAEKVYRRSLAIYDAKLGQNHLKSAAVLNNLAGIYRRMAEYPKAEAHYRRALQITEANLGKNHPETALMLNNLANLYRDIGDDSKAESLFLRSLAIREITLGKDHPHTAVSLYNLAGVYRSMGQAAKAESLHLRALQIREAKFGKDNLETAQSLNGLSVLYWSIGQQAKAIPPQRRSLEIYEAQLGKDHPDTAHALNGLAILYHELGQNEIAEPLFRRCLEIREATLGKTHPDVSAPLHNLANLYGATGDYAKAESFYRRVIAIREVSYGGDHPETALALHNLAWNFASQKEWAQAVQSVQKAQQATALLMARSLSALTEKEQLVFLETNFKNAHLRALSLGYAAPKEAASASAEWLLNGKAIAHQTLAEQTLLVRDANSPETKQLADDLRNTRSQLAAHVNRAPQSGMEAAYQNVLRDLKTREQLLGEKLARAVGRPYRTNAWVPLAELQAKLNAKSVFVDIARLPIFDFKANKWGSPRYVAWITQPKGREDVQLIDLGEAGPIDELVEATRRALLDSAKDVAKVGEGEALKSLAKPLEALSAKVLHPLLPTLAKFDEWIVCPDGALWLTPWNALLLKDGTFAVEKHLIRHVVSGRDLVLEQPAHKTDTAYLFADPDYDLSPGQVTVAAGTRGLSSPLLGQRLRGSIGAWNVSLEFRADEVVIYDEDAGGEVAGKGTWKLDDNGLAIQTGISRFQAALAAGEFRGQRSKKAADGTTTTDAFRMDAPRDDVRAVGAAGKAIPRVQRLPGTAAEAEAVRPRIEQWLGQAPKVFLEAKASETTLKAVRNPRALTLATHGYFLPAQEVDAKAKDTAASLEPNDVNRALATDKSGQPIENPLLRCGLLLAGCNKRAEAKPGEDDGILTGLEIVGMDLRGAELVVLSACETGLGDVRSGEGVAGLRQAFQMAGAKGVLASLWQVPDRETALLMNAFYGELTKGKSQTAALREAQLSRIAARKASFGAAHPFFWGAFTLTNRGVE